MEKGLNIMVVEDEELIASMMEMQLDIMGHHLVAIVDNSDDALDAVEKHDLDIIMMDISIKGAYDGVELSQMISSIQDVEIIYVTSNHDDLSFRRASRTGPAAFITKPFTDIQFQRTLGVVADQIQSQKINLPHEVSPLIEEGTLFIKKNNELKKIFITDIFYLEADGRYCRIYTSHDMFLAQLSLKEMIAKLPEERFLQCHRQYIINISKVKSINIEDDMIIMEERSVPMSRREKDKIMEKLNYIQ